MIAWLYPESIWLSHLNLCFLIRVWKCKLSLCHHMVQVWIWHDFLVQLWSLTFEKCNKRQSWAMDNAGGQGTRKLFCGWEYQFSKLKFDVKVHEFLTKSFATKHCKTTKMDDFHPINKTKYQFLYMTWINLLLFNCTKQYSSLLCLFGSSLASPYRFDYFFEYINVSISSVSSNNC